MRAVFDLDDTICIHENRDYANAVPVNSVICKMRELKKAGWEIIIYSSRGQVSCNGDIRLIEEKNRATAEKWLVSHGVPFDKLLFGKPIADLYVDDKALSAKEFKSAKIGMLYGGGSCNAIYRIGSVVKKYFGQAEDVARFKDWIADNDGACKYPEVISYLYNGVYMDFIDGTRLVDDCCWQDVETLLGIINRFKSKPMQRFTIEPQVRILLSNKADDIEWDNIVDVVKNFIERHEKEIANHASYCHGDLILSNVLKSKDGFFFIDPRYFRESSSYLFDLAKLRMSLLDYERLFGLSVKSNREYLQRFDDSLDPEIGRIVIGLSLMYICRLYRYKSDDGKRIVKGLAKEVLSGNEWIYEE